MITWEVLTIKSAVKTINEAKVEIKKEIEKGMLMFDDAMLKLKPLIMALNKATPLIEVVNSIASLFKRGKK